MNAIDKLIELLLVLRALNEDWRQRPDKQHELLATPEVLTTVSGGGAFASNWPAAAWAILNCCYLPADADPAGYGTRVMAEIEEQLAAFSASDSWLRDRPPEIEWLCEFPPGSLSGTLRWPRRSGGPGTLGVTQALLPRWARRSDALAAHR